MTIIVPPAPVKRTHTGVAVNTVLSQTMLGDPDVANRVGSEIVV